MKLSFPSYSGSHTTSQRSHNKPLRSDNKSVLPKPIASLNVPKHHATARSSCDHKALLDQRLFRVPRPFGIEGFDLTKAILPNYDLSGLDIRKVNFTEANLVYLNAKKSSWLQDSSLARANLSGANLSEANLSRINLSGANLSNADLSWADLTGTDFSQANLSGANLSGATLDRANFSGANLDGAKMLGLLPKSINWEGSNLTGIITTEGDYIARVLDPESTLHKAINPPSMKINNVSSLIPIHTLLKTYRLYPENLTRPFNALFFLSKMTFNSSEVIEYSRKQILPELKKLEKLLRAPRHDRSRAAIITCIENLEQNTNTQFKKAGDDLAQLIEQKIKPKDKSLIKDETKFI